MLSVDEIQKFIREDTASERKRLARIGDRYYHGKHDILDYRMFYFNADGKLVEDQTRSNQKIPHPFFTELVDQTVQYMLSGKNGMIHSDVPELQKELDRYFDDEFISELHEVLTGAVSKGFEYLYAYKGKDDRIHFECADSMGVVEVREKETDDGCAYVIYWYVDRIGKTNEVIKRVQVWDKDQTVYYVQQDDGTLILDKDEEINPRPHILYRKNKGDALYYDGFGFIPWFKLEANRQSQSGLMPIKALIDDYDMMSCGLSNNLIDFDNPIHVVRGFEGDNLDELEQNLKTKKLIGVDSEGGVEVHTVAVPYEARQAKMHEDEVNIYRFGMGLNSAMVGDGNVTNVVIKSRYALLDMKCNKLEIRLKAFLKKLIRVVLAEINTNLMTDFHESQVWFDFEREIMTNSSDNATIEKVDAERKQIQINTLLGLNGVIDDETILKMICEILEVDYDEVKTKIPTDPMQMTDSDLQALTNG